VGKMAICVINFNGGFTVEGRAEFLAEIVQCIFPQIVTPSKNLEPPPASFNNRFLKSKI